LEKEKRVSPARCHAAERGYGLGDGLTFVGEVSLSELEFLDLEATLEELLSSIATDSHVNGDVFVSLNTEGTDGVLGLGVDGLLVGEILEHLCGLGELITRLTCAQVQDELVNLDGSHLVILLLWVLLQIHIFFLNQLNLLIIKASADFQKLFDTQQTRSLLFLP
jgi:hypothetical protein